MRRPQIFLAALTLVTGGVFALTSIAASAQSGGTSLSISPPVFELSVNPGERVSNNIRVTNLGEGDHRVFVDKRNFTALGEEGGVDLTEEDTSYSLASWISVDKDRATIPSGESEVFEFTITVPANAEPGGHFGSLVFKTEPGQLAEGQAGASIGQEVGALLLVRVAGDVSEEVSIAGFGASRGFYEKGPIDFVTRTENTGNVHVKPSGTITITNMFGREVATLDLDQRNILPDAIRRVETKWDDSSFRFGRYTATLSMAYGSDGTILNATTSIFIVPYKWIAGVLLALAAAGFVGYRYRDRFREAYKALAGKR